MSEDALKLIGECSKERLPSHIERLILDVKSELGDSLTDYDLTVVLLFGLMAETGFTPLSDDDVLTGQISPNGSNYDTQKLKTIQKMPKNWRKSNGSLYSMKFHLNRCQDSVCQLLASKIEPGTSTIAIEDNLIVNLFVTCSPTAKAIHLQPSRYVTSKNADIPDMFDKLHELSMLFKNAVHPLRNTILEEYGKLNASLIGIPTEIKLKIFEYLSVPGGWKALSETCTDLHILGNDPMLWKSYLKRDFGSIAKHRASIEEMSKATSEINWKTEYVARYIRANPKRPKLSRGPFTGFEITSRTASRAEDSVRPAVRMYTQGDVITFDPDFWANASEDDGGINVAEWPFNMDEYFDDEDVLETLWTAPKDKLVGLFNMEDDCGSDASYCNPGYGPDEYDSEIESKDESTSKVDTLSRLRALEPCSGEANWFEPHTSSIFRRNRRGRKTVFNGTETVKNSGASTNLTRRLSRLEETRSGANNDDRTEQGAMSSVAEKLKDADASTSIASWADPDDMSRWNKTVTNTEVPESMKEARQDHELGDFVSSGHYVPSPHELQEYRSLQARNDSHLVHGTTPQGLDDLINVHDSGKGSGNLKEYDGFLPPEQPWGAQDPFDFNLDQIHWTFEEDYNIFISEDDLGVQHSFELNSNEMHLDSEEYHGLPIPEEVLGVQHSIAMNFNEMHLDSEEYDDFPTSEEILDVQQSYALSYERQRAFESRDGYPLSDEIMGVQDPSEFDTDDVDTASVQNNNGSEPDLVGILHEVALNGKGDADYFGGVVPCEYTYREVSPGEPYV